MASEEEDQDVFEITDYTTASDWERFVANIEEVIHEWKLPNLKPCSPLKKGDITYGTWTEQSEDISFADFKFQMVYHCLKDMNEVPVAATQPDNDNEEEPLPEFLNDMMTTSNDFFVSSRVISQWYGLRRFIIISPAKGTEVIANESRAKLLLSSVCVAINNTNCYIPVFIQLHQRNAYFYLGIGEGRGIRTDFQMVHLRKCPPNSAHLAGLLDIFKAKLNCHYSRIPPVMVSICFTYLLKDWDHSASWPQQPPDFDSIMPSIGSSELSVLPFGAWEDPVSEIRLLTIWPRLNEDVVVDNNVCTDLDPIQAPLWCLRTQFTNDPACLLVEYLNEFLMLCDTQESTEQLLGLSTRSQGDVADANIAQALDRLTNPVPVVNPMKASFTSFGHTKESPIPEPKLNDILFFLFPDAVGKTVDDDICISRNDTDESSSSREDRFAEVKETLSTFKSVPVNSLLFYLAICMCHVNHTFGRVYAVAHLWHEFVLEMRHRWENNLFIPGLERGQPNLSTCLLYQKLQMLNYCIERKKARELQQYGKKSNDNEDNSSDEEFFECMDDSDSSRKSVGDYDSQDDRGTGDTGAYTDAVNHQPEGRLRICNNLKLIESNEPLYIPITQEPAPMTEDQLEEHAEVLVQLGTDKEGVELRAQMQSACLLSDMQAFKAANPGCCIEDFVRWYSPRDWIEDEDDESGPNSKSQGGRLSTRMLIPGNLWQDVWKSAKPVPIRRQRRLFDDTKEGEKVLHFLVSMRPSDVVLRLMPILIHASILTLMKHDEPMLPIVSQMLQSIATFSAKLSKLPLPNAEQYREVIDRISVVEILLSQCKALKNLFRHSANSSGTEDEVHLEQLISNLMEKRELYLPGGVNTPVGKWVLRLFQDSQKEEESVTPDGEIKEQAPPSQMQFSNPERRQFILRCSLSRPAPYSAPTPQRMYACLSDNEYRLAGAFSQDTTFQ